MSAAETPKVVINPGVDPLIGRVLGNYVIKRRLTEGGMGHVYIAEHEKLGHRAAVKVLKREMATDDEWSRRFLTEAQAGARIQSPNLVRVIDFGKMEDGYDYLLMEYLDGVPLDQYCARLRADDRLDAVAVLTFAEQILNGLGAAHAERVFHRDLKPANVMVIEEHTGRPLLKLIDFGLAKAGPLMMAGGQGERENQASLLAGTPEYISPEQAMGQIVDGRADLYSLGVMLYEMLAGQLPFDGNVEAMLQAHLSQRPPPLPKELAEWLPEGLNDLVESLLEKSPDRRPASAEAAKKTVQRMLRKARPEDTQMKPNPLLVPQEQSASSKAAAQSTQIVLPRRMQANRTRVVAIASALLLLVVIAAWFALRPAPVERVEPLPLAVPTPPVPRTVAEVIPQPAEPEPVKVEDPPELTPLPLMPIKSTRVPVKPRFVISEKDCAIDAQWAKNRLRDLDDLSALSAKNRAVGAVEMEGLERELSSAITQAQTSGDCVKVTQSMEALRVRVMK